MEKRKIRWGILGSGKIAQDFVTALSYLEDAQVVAIGSRNQKSADEFGDRFKIPNRYSSYEALAKDPNVEIIYVSTIHPLHRENSILCLQNGKAVLSEKPLTMNAQQSEEVMKVAREKKLLYMEGMWTRFFPAMIKLRQLIQDGTLGDIKLVMADFGFKNEGIARLDKLELGGGAVLDIGVYPISFSSMVFGGKYPTTIKAVGHLNSVFGSDDQSAITLGYKPDQHATLAITLLADTPKEATVIGEKGRVRIHSRFWCPTQLTVSIVGKPDEVLEFPLPEKKPEHSFHFNNSIGLQYEAAHVHKLLYEGKLESNIITLDESLVVMKIMDEVRKQIGLKYSYE